MAALWMQSCNPVAGRNTPLRRAELSSLLLVPGAPGEPFTHQTTWVFELSSRWHVENIPQILIFTFSNICICVLEANQNFTHLTMNEYVLEYKAPHLCGFLFFLYQKATALACWKLHQFPGENTNFEMGFMSQKLWIPLFSQEKTLNFLCVKPMINWSFPSHSSVVSISSYFCAVMT